MKIFITGGAGFIGSNFIHYWQKKYPGDYIINLDFLTYAGNLENLKGINEQNYKFVKGDICDTKLVRELLEGIDLVLHFAAESHVDNSIKNSADFIKTNVEGTRVLLDASNDNGKIRFHHVSTDEVFGALKINEKPFNEATPYDPQSPYSASKAASDHLVRAYFHTHKLPITISNCSNNYGPRQFPEKLIPLFVTRLMQNKKVPVYGLGENIRDWIHVDDHNAGLESIIQKGKIGQTYCLGGGNEISNIKLTKKILKLMNKGEEMIEYVTDRPGHDLRYAIDYSKAKNQLAWEPKVDFDKGLSDTVKWYLQKYSYYN